MRPVRWSRDALDDLKAQVEFIAKANPAAARKVAARIRSIAAEIGTLATGRVGRVHGTFEKVVPGLPYVIAYAISPGSRGREVVTILHVIHGPRNWPQGEWPA